VGKLGNVPEPAALPSQRVYRADDVAEALHRTVQSVKDRVERGASLRGWSARDPANTLRVWLVDADHADAADPEIASAQLPSGYWPLPSLGPPAKRRAGTSPDTLSGLRDAGRSDGSGGLYGELGQRTQEQLEMAQRGEAVEREQRLLTERDAARQEARDLRAQLEELRTELQNVRRGIVVMLGGATPSPQ
jgi:hypothetical protein